MMFPKYKQCGALTTGTRELMMTIQGDFERARCRTTLLNAGRKLTKNVIVGGRL